MNDLRFIASPWWVNLLIFVPLLVFLWFRNNLLMISKKHLFIAALFGMAFGFVEASVAVYLRAAAGFLPGFMGRLSHLTQKIPSFYQPGQILNHLPQTLLTVEVEREAATIIMLASLALLTAKKFRDRCAIFLWVFAAWDISYYLSLWLTIGWPDSLTNPDVLFLIPVPWYAPVWFPILVSSLTMIAIALCAPKRRKGVFL